jgi:choline dehydrogenase-like flavoprotein
MGSSITLGLSSMKERLRTYYRGRSTTFGAQVFGTMVPTPDVGVALPAGADPDDPSVRPVIMLRYDTAAVANVVAARERLRTVFADAGVGLTLPGPFHELRPGSSVHYGGSVRMHASPEFGVLDGWNRIHDAPNVVVADSSCFTTGPEKNPTLTAMAIASRAADQLASDLQGGSVR